ncbi:hypothetical protein IWQ61_005301 [Dispira simplex]|nr:hypothetical protein IWQ61_005301 [Dispira simplex]
MQKTTKHLALRGILLLCAVSATLARAEQSEIGPDNGNGASSSPDQGGSVYPPVQQYPPKLPEQEQKQMPETEPKPEPEQPAYPPAQQVPPKQPEPKPETEPKPESEQPAYPPAQQIPPKQPEPQPEQPTYSAETLTKPEVVETSIATPGVPEPEIATPVETPVESGNGGNGPEVATSVEPPVENGNGGNSSEEATSVEAPVENGNGGYGPEEATSVEAPVENGNGGNGPEDGDNTEEAPAGDESDTPTTLPAFVTQLLGLLDKIGDEGQEGLAEDQSLPTEMNTEGGEGEPKEDLSAVQTDDGNGGDNADGGIAARNLATDKEPEREPGRPTPTPSARYTTEDIYTRVRIPLYRLTAFQQAIRTITTTAQPEEETELAANEEEVNPEVEEAGEEGQNRGERRPGRDSNSRVRATFTVTETHKTTTSEETTLTETTTSPTTSEETTLTETTTSPTTSEETTLTETTTSPTTTHKQPSTTETTHTTTTAIGHAARGATPQIGGLVTLLALFLALLSGACDRVLI